MQTELPLGSADDHPPLAMSGDPTPAPASPTGPASFDGASGSNGSSGANGSGGSSGSNGPNGPNGPGSANRPNGPDGAKGAPSAAQKRRATARFMLSHPLHLFSLGFGSGLSPIMPGTVGTLFAWASFAVLNPHLTVLEWAVLIVVGFFAGIPVCDFTARRMGIDDPSPVVWDEIVAFWLVLLMVTPATPVGQFWAFVVFRFFDMVKPPPIRYFDRRLKGGFGIMFDDLVAAFFTLLVIALWRMAV